MVIVIAFICMLRLLVSLTPLVNAQEPQEHDMFAPEHSGASGAH